MAIDSAAKRFSMMGFGVPTRKYVVPSGTVDAAERLTFLDLYSGIAADAPTEPPVTGGGDANKFLQPILSSVLGSA